jgi:hypothetical protein
MYEQSTLLADVVTETDRPFVLLPGTLGANTYRRKVVGNGTLGVPMVLDIKGDILAPAGPRKYSVARLSLTLSEGIDVDAAFGPQPIASTQVTFNAPFGQVDGQSVTTSDVIAKIRAHLAFIVQYTRGSKLSAGEIATWNTLVGSSAFYAALSDLFDGVR